MTVLDLFSGIGGFALACNRAGFQHGAICEQDRNCRKVLAKHWPDVECHDDVRTLTADAIRGRVDLICGGFPCQDLSVAGRRAGLAGERSGLWWEFDRLIGDLAPCWVLIENVPGLLSSNGGRDFGAVLGALAERGYGTAYRVLDAQFFGVPQRRRRVFIVGCSGDWRRAAAVLFEPESLPWDHPPSRKEGARVARTIKARADSSWTPDGLGNDIVTSLRRNPHDYDHDGDESKLVYALQERACSENPDNGPQGKGWQEDKAFTLEARHHVQAVAYQCHGSNVGPMGTLRNGNGNESGGVPFVATPAVRRLTVLECQRLQGFPDDWFDGLDLSDSAKYRALGNAVAVPVVEWICRRMKDE